MKKQMPFNAKTALVLVNLGSPNSYKRKDVVSYLREFLSDPDVIDLPPWIRLPLVYGLIIPLRSRATAASYRRIWKKQSPLIEYSQALCKEIQPLTPDNVSIFLAMRYGQPSLERVLKDISKDVFHRLVIFPLFPQYANATSGSILKYVHSLREKYPLPPIFWVPEFFQDPGYIEGYIHRAKKYDIDSYDHILFSFHGLPERHLRKHIPGHNCEKDGCSLEIHSKNLRCYRAQCYQTARLMQEKLKLSKECFSICFQSRLGRDKWLEPYTEDTIIRLAKEGKKRLLVFCPSFVADCLETLYEISIEYGEVFQEHGGETLTLVESLNNNNTWAQTVLKLAQKPRYLMAM